MIAASTSVEWGSLLQAAYVSAAFGIGVLLDRGRRGASRR